MQTSKRTPKGWRLDNPTMGGKTSVLCQKRLQYIQTSYIHACFMCFPCLPLVPRRKSPPSIIYQLPYITIFWYRKSMYINLTNKCDHLRKRMLPKHQRYQYHYHPSAIHSQPSLYSGSHWRLCPSIGRTQKKQQFASEVSNWIMKRWNSKWIGSYNSRESISDISPTFSSGA